MKGKSTEEFVYPEEYLDWVKTFEQLNFKIPFYMKEHEASPAAELTPYSDYLFDLTKYLVTYYKNTHPLSKFESIEEEFKSTFEEEWEQGSLFGWEDFLTRRLFGNLELD